MKVTKITEGMINGKEVKDQVLDAKENHPHSIYGSTIVRREVLNGDEFTDNELVDYYETDFLTDVTVNRVNGKTLVKIEHHND